MSWKEVPIDGLVAKILQKRGISNSPLNPSGGSEEGIPLDALEKLMGRKFSDKEAERGFGDPTVTVPVVHKARLKETTQTIYVPIAWPPELPPPPHPVVLATQATKHNTSVPEYVLGESTTECIVSDNRPLDLGNKLQIENKKKKLTKLTTPRGAIQYGGIVKSFYVCEEDIEKIELDSVGQELPNKKSLKELMKNFIVVSLSKP